MNSYTWTIDFRLIYDKALAQFQAGLRDFGTYFSNQELAFIEAIGARPAEIYDFVEDADQLDFGTALLITATRREYFLAIQHGRPSSHRLSAGEFPAKRDQLAGIPWLPRLILKAKCRFRGELPDDLMFCCGGDRAFFDERGIHPADFLRFVWSVDADETKILEYVNRHR